MSDEVLARLHVIIKTERGRIPKVDLEKLEARLAEAARSWSDLLEDALIEAVGEQGGVRSHRRFERAFPSSYPRHSDAAVAVEDIHHIEQATASGELSLHLPSPAVPPVETLHSKHASQSAIT